MSGTKRHTLEMYLRAQLIGLVHFDSDTEQFSLEHTQEWQSHGFALSPQLSLTGAASSSQVSLYLANLLPENKGLDHLIDACQALGFSVSKKYERNQGSQSDVREIREGVSLARLFSLAKFCSCRAFVVKLILFGDRS